MAAADVLALQRTAGNAAVADLVAQRKSSSLRQGAEGQEVKELQSGLNHVDEVQLPLVVDGIFGPLTDKAVRQFQRAHPPLVADGVAGPLTQAAIAGTKEEEQDVNQISRKVFERGAKAFNEGKFGLAFDYFAKSHELTPKPQLLFNQAQSLRRMGGRREQAIALFEEFLSQDPGGTRAAEATAAVAELRGPGKSGDEKVDTDNARTQFEQGAALFAAGKFALAFDAFSRSDEAFHKASLVFNRAQSLRRLGGRRDEAIALFEQYLAEAPDGDRAKEAEEAVAELKGPGQSGDTEVDKANARLLFNKANALFSAGKFALAFDAFSQSDEAFHVASLTFNRAQCLRKLGARKDEAVALYEAFLAEDPTSPRAREAQFYRDELLSQGAAP